MITSHENQEIGRLVWLVTQSFIGEYDVTNYQGTSQELITQE